MWDKLPPSTACHEVNWHGLLSFQGVRLVPSLELQACTTPSHLIWINVSLCKLLSVEKNLGWSVYICNLVYISTYSLYKLNNHGWDNFQQQIEKQMNSYCIPWHQCLKIYKHLCHTKLKPLPLPDDGSIIIALCFVKRVLILTGGGRKDIW